MSTLPFTLPNYSDTNPAAPTGKQNLKWQQGSPYPAPDGSGNTWQDVSESFPNIGGVDARTTTTETIGLASQGKLVTLKNASAIAASLDSTVPNQFYCAVAAIGAGSATLTPSSGTITLNGGMPGSSASLAAGLAGWLFFDGTNWQLFTGGGSGGGSFTAAGDLSGTSSTQEVIGILSKLIDGSAPTDGQILQYSSTTGKWELVVDRPIFPVSAVVGKPSAGQLVCIYTAAASMVFPANFATPNSYGSVGTNPAATATYTVYKNGSSIGTVSISTAGVFTFTTTGGVSFSLNAGDRLTIVAPGTQDTTLADVGITLVGTRTATVPSGAVPPVFTWRGTYAGGTAYNPFDVVGFTVSGKVQSYVCIAATTGNDPTHTAFWSLMAQAGADGTTSAAQVQDESFVYAADTGTANAYAVSLSPAPTLVAGSLVVFKATNANTGASTLAVNGGTAVAIKKGGSNALTGGEIAAGQITTVIYDGTNFQMVGGGSGDTTAEYLIGAVDATLANAHVLSDIYLGPDFQPASAGSFDDEFSGSSMSGSWTWLNQGAATVAVANGRSAIAGDNSASLFRGMYQALPGSTPWEATLRIHCEAPARPSFVIAGLFLLESATNKLMWFGPFSSAEDVRVGHGLSTGAVNTYDITGAIQWNSVNYLKVRSNGTSLFFSVSYDGVIFTQVLTQTLVTNFTTAPNKIGFGVALFSPAAATIVCEWFRRTV